MKTLILNGSPAPDGAGLDAWIDTYAEELRAAGHEAETQDLRSLGVRTCTGCWSCWWACPGACVLKDGMEALYPRILSADLVVWAFPLMLGTANALTKVVQDRCIPLVHPYIEVENGECLHRRRYAHVPDFAVVLQPSQDDDQDDIDRTVRLFRRFARNFRCTLRFAHSTAAVTPKEAADETAAA